MVIDTGMDLEQTRRWLDLCADYVDYLKLAFGTSLLYSPGLLGEKIRMAHRSGVTVYPGGTLLEIAVMQDKLRPFVDRAKAIGFKAIEVSDGTISMTPTYRETLIRALVEEGFEVISEVGKKHPADRLSTGRLREQIQEDLEAGATKVIVEGRESGKGVVIYRDDGSIDSDELEELARSVSEPGLLLWEAPQASQQQDLVMRFGCNVNLGNIHPRHVLSLEALRVGLRGDTLRHLLMTRPEMRRIRPSWPPGSYSSASDRDRRETL